MTVSEFYLICKSDIGAWINKYKFLYENSVCKDSENALMNLHKMQGLQCALSILDEEHERTEKKSPFTGGQTLLLSDPNTVTFRGEEITVDREYYHCVNTGHNFTDAVLDEDFIWKVFHEYCRRKNYETFSEIERKEILKNSEKIFLDK